MQAVTAKLFKSLLIANKHGGGHSRSSAPAATNTVASIIPPYLSESRTQMTEPTSAVCPFQHAKRVTTSACPISIIDDHDHRRSSSDSNTTSTATTTAHHHHHHHRNHNHHHHPHHHNLNQHNHEMLDRSPNDSTLDAAAGLSYDEIPTPRRLPLVGTLLDLILAGGAEYVHQYCDMRHRELGPIYREKLGNVEAVFVADAKLVQKIYQHEGKYPQHMVPEPWIIYNQNKGIRRGLFFMDGEEWSNRRRTLNKVFLMPQVVGQYTSVFNDIVSDILSNWIHKLGPDVERKGLLITDMEKELYNWSIESLGTMIFGRRLGCISQSNSQSADSKTNNNLPDIHEFVNCVQQIFVESSNMQLIPPKMAHYLKLPMWKRFEEAAGKALDLAFQYVNENARQEETDADHGKRSPGIVRQLMSDGEIKLDELSRIIVDLFIAAADTTSHATQWALYLLSRNAHAQEQLFREIQEVTRGEPIEERHLKRMSYVKGVIKEALRLYPVAPFLTRYLTDDLNLGGYMVPKGQLVCISLYTTGRKEEYFERPMLFKPERWIRDQATGRHQVTDNYACLPFGVGVRSCIGRRVAEVQMQFFISKMIQQFQILPTSDKEVDIKLRMITTPEKAIDLIIQRRQ